jgi:hypothetical protein
VESCNICSEGVFKGFGGVKSRNRRPGLPERLGLLVLRRILHLSLEVSVVASRASTAFLRGLGRPANTKLLAEVSAWTSSICWGIHGADLLAIEYGLKYQKHLKGLVISNMAASADSFVKHVTKIRSEFPTDFRAKLELYENANKTGDPAYQALLFEKLYKVFICRLDPWPDPVLRSLGGWNQRVYKALQGRSEFEATGRMKGWNRWADLPNRISKSER